MPEFGFQFEGKPQQPKTERREDREERERREKIAHVQELVSPTSKRDDLYELITREVYKGSDLQEERKARLREIGYDPNYLEQVGKDNIRRWEELINKTSFEGGLSPREQEESKRLFGLCFREQEGKGFRHSELTIGAMTEFSRQIGKLMAAGLEGDPKKREETFFGSSSVEISPQMVERFVKERNSEKMEEVAKKMNSIIEKIESPDKQKQYTAIRGFLFRESKEK